MAVAVLAIVQIVLSCRVSLYGSKTAYFENSIKEQEEELSRLVLLMAEKSNLVKLNEFAEKRGFVAKPSTLVLSSEMTVAYNNW